MGRELFAVPGSPLDPRCRGSNDLLRTGAHLVESAADVLPVLQAQLAPPPARAVAEASSRFDNAPPASDEARRLVLENLGHDPVEVDELVRRCHLPTGTVMAALLELELGGRLEMLPGHIVALL